MKKTLLSLAIVSGCLTLISESTFAACSDIDRNTLQNAATSAKTTLSSNPMWVTAVDETGKICHVVNSNFSNSDKSKGQSNTTWLLSRVISAQKANTAVSLSTDTVPFSTAMVYGAAQPGGSLYGVQHSNPVDASRAYAGSPNTYGTNGDPLINKRIGGINVFGGGLALYKNGFKVGAIGVSGDSSCMDHIFAWEVRSTLSMEPASATDKLQTSNASSNGSTTFHPNCGYQSGDAHTADSIVFN